MLESGTMPLPRRTCAEQARRGKQSDSYDDGFSHFILLVCLSALSGTGSSPCSGSAQNIPSDCAPGCWSFTIIRPTPFENLFLRFLFGFCKLLVRFS